MAKKSQKEFEREVLTSFIVVTIVFGIMILGNQYMIFNNNHGGEWECIEWEESNTEGYYKQIETGNELLIRTPNMHLWIPERVCVKEQLVREVVNNGR